MRSVPPTPPPSPAIAPGAAARDAVFANWGATAAAMHAVAAGVLAACCSGLLLMLFPRLEMGLFAGGAARLAALVSGSPILRMESAWALPAAHSPVLVTAACSGTDYFLIVAALLGWRLARGRRSILRAALGGIALGLPFAITVNALRIAALAQVHHWIIPCLPAPYAPFIHLLTGVAVFLPALIALHLIL